MLKDLNDTEKALNEIATKLKRVQPDEVHILQPSYLHTEPWVKSPDKETLSRARTIFGNIARVIDPNTYSYAPNGYEYPVDKMEDIITPML